MRTTISNGIIEVTVDSAGSELKSVKSVATGTEYIWQGSPDTFNASSPLLFPIVGRLRKARYVLDGRIYDMNIHGFAAKMAFELVEKRDDYLCYKIVDTADTLAQYPYHFEVYQSYRLDGASLRIGYRVVNTNERTMFYQIGAHPAFNVPIEPSLSFEDYKVVFEEKEIKPRIVLDGGMSGHSEEFLVDADAFALSHELFARDTLIFKKLKSTYVKIVSDKDKKAVKIDFAGFPYLGIWSWPGECRYICVEPWFGADTATDNNDEFVQKEGVQSLRPGEVFTSEYGITIEE